MPIAMKKRAFLVCSFLWVSPLIWAQERLTAQEAVNRVLEKNFALRLSQLDVLQAQTNNTWGNAGLWPTVQATATQNRAFTNSEQTRNDGTVNRLDNAKNFNLNYGVSLGWTVFDGLGMFARKTNLEQLEGISQTQLQAQVLTQVREVLVAYYQLVQEIKVAKALEESLQVTQERLDLAQARYSIGKAAKLEVLNAQVDLNADQRNLLLQKDAVKAQMIELNRLLAESPNQEYLVEEQIKLSDLPLYEQLLDKALSQNPNLQAALQLEEIAQSNLKITRSTRWPQLAITTGYNFAETESSLGFTSATSNKGFNVGFSAAVPLFDGFNQRRRERLAQLEIERSQLVKQEQNLWVEQQLANAYRHYQTQLRLLESSAEFVRIAEQNLDITQAKHQIGSVTPIEYRTAQINLVQAQVDYAQVQAQAKWAEIQLFELIGEMPQP